MRKRNYIAVLKLSETEGIGIVELGEARRGYVIYQKYNGEECSRLGNVMIRYDEEGFSYFISKGQRYYLNRFTRLYKPVSSGSGISASDRVGNLMYIRRYRK